MLQTIRVFLACTLLAALATTVVADDRKSDATPSASALQLATPESQGLSRRRLAHCRPRTRQGEER
jgi:hypothetical protein